MAASDDCRAKTISLKEIHGVDNPLPLVVGLSDARDTLNDQISLRQRSSLIKATDVNLASERNPEGFGTEELLLHQLNNAVVDSHAQLHRQLRRNNVGDNQDATKHDLVTRAIGIRQRHSQNVVGGSDRKN